MQWTAVMCSTDLGWEAWLALCVAIVGLWAVAIAGATALFGASTRKPTVRGFMTRMPSQTCVPAELASAADSPKLL